jgi:hypothetical protein
MALCWDVKNVKNRDEVCSVKDGDRTIWHPVTEGIGFYMLTLGIDHLEEKNVEEFFNRMTLADTTFGAPIMNTTEGPYYISKEELRQHIGMRSNASRLTKQQFHKNLIQYLERKTRSELEKRYGGSK